MNRAKLDKLYDELLQGVDMESLSPGDQLSIAKSLIAMVKFIRTRELPEGIWKSRQILAESVLEEAVVSLNKILEYTPTEELPPGFTSRVFSLNQSVAIMFEAINEEKVVKKSLEDLAYRLERLDKRKAP